MSSVYHIDAYRPTSSESFFFDNNIWMLLHYPATQYQTNRIQKYAGLLQDIINLNCLIFINSMVVSEFVNSWLRSDYKNLLYLSPNIDFKKDFVGSDEYKVSVDEIESALNQIFNITQRGNDDFNALDVNKIVSGLRVRDFNDNYYLALAERKRWTLISDDKDMLSNNAYNVKVVSDRRL